MTPPAKKTTPAKATSLTELLDNKEENNQEVEENQNDKVDNAEENDNSNATSEVVNENDKEDGTILKKDDADTNESTGLSKSVTATVPNKTPGELAAETPDETSARYGAPPAITKQDANNPRVQVYSDTQVKQVPSGTHLHPDVAKDSHNYGIAERTTDSAQVKRVITETYDFADSAEHNDKF